MCCVHQKSQADRKQIPAALVIVPDLEIPHADPSAPLLASPVLRAFLEREVRLRKCLPEDEIKLWLDWVLVLLATSIEMGFAHPDCGVRCRVRRLGPRKFELDRNEFVKLEQQPFMGGVGEIVVRTVYEVSIRFGDRGSITRREEKSVTAPFCFATP